MELKDYNNRIRALRREFFEANGVTPEEMTLALKERTLKNDLAFVGEQLTAMASEARNAA